MKKTYLFLLLTFFLLNYSIACAQGNKNESVLNLKINDGVSFFNGIKVGDKVSKIENKFGDILLYTSNEIYLPDFGVKFKVEGEFIREISLYPVKGISMGQILGFEIYSRNKYTWMLKQVDINKSKPQDIMGALGIKETNPFSKKKSYKAETSDGGYYRHHRDNLSYSINNAIGKQRLNFEFSTFNSNEIKTSIGSVKEKNYFLRVVENKNIDN